jgi:hypothetical protein
MLSVIYAVSQTSHYAEWHCAECQYVECRYDKCRGAIFYTLKKTMTIQYFLNLPFVYYPASYIAIFLTYYKI